MYIHQLDKWPGFIWDYDRLATKLGDLRHRQGKILGEMNALGFKLKEAAILQTLTLDVTKSSEIEGELLDDEQVRSSIAKRLGIEIGGTIPADRNVEGIVEMMLDATQRYTQALTEERLFNWHGALFPIGRSGLYKIVVANWRQDTKGPMVVVSGAMGREKVHFEAPAASRLPMEMEVFLDWFNTNQELDPVIKAAIAHLWFITIHPFEDGNGRIARGITDMQLARADQTEQRFYSMSAQIQKERNAYYQILERTQKGTLDITAWLYWFMDCLDRAMDSTSDVLEKVKIRGNFWKMHQNTLLNSRQQKMLNILLDDFVGKLTASKWAKITRASTDTALRDIQDLVNKGVLLKEEGGGRNTNYGLILPQ